MTIKERMEAIKVLEEGIEMPWEVLRVIGKPELAGSQVSFGKELDFVNLEDVQRAAAWMVEQFGLPKKAKK